MEKKSNLADYLLDSIRSKYDQKPIGLYYNLTLLPELEDFNRADTVNMSDEEMNKFRHVAGTKQVMNDLGVPRGFGYALGKEIYDFKNDGWNDTKNDLKNDFRALKLHLKNPGLKDSQLYNHVFTNYITPYR
ncbi:MAG: hypothetical protein NC408_04420 [Candidatus Gastranaerophilales bacterium]|nr:hypothetical protein [Candidatus Gastranaerophilales bacterium]MCM1072284.1 hypothetical protein [Bacteroides sp.]